MRARAEASTTHLPRLREVVREGHEHGQNIARAAEGGAALVGFGVEQLENFRYFESE